MRKIYCIGETVYDIIFKNNQPVAAKAGGSMLNSAVSMGRMLLPINYISEYGSDNIGNEIDRFLNSCNVNTQYVYRYSKGKTSIAIASLNENNDATYSFYKDLPRKRMNFDFPEPVADDIVLFGSFYAINKDVRKQIKNFVNIAKQAGAIIIYDPNFRKAHLWELPELMPYILENLQLADIVRGSNEDLMMIFKANSLNEAYKNVSQYCLVLIYTMNANGVYLKTDNQNIFCEAPKINPVSTIGAGDNFNAGIIYGLSKEKITKKNFLSTDDNTWKQILSYGISLASEVCLSYDNYISDKFAKKITTLK